jgi:hypothetical protein
MDRLAGNHHFLVHRRFTRQGKMSLILWLLAGGSAGWVGFRFIGDMIFRPFVV